MARLDLYKAVTFEQPTRLGYPEKLRALVGMDSEAPPNESVD